MTDHTQKLLKEIEVISNDNLMLRAEIKENEWRNEKLKRAFLELIDVHLEMRERFGFGEFVQDYKYDWIEKAGLLDTQ
jgi:hypothetical protein